tara:strand:+ start:412 stop:711 length:300 start_codon:yes stop_codon:yes gene_type:complete
MNWFSKFIKFITPPAKISEAKKAAVIKEATVTLKPLNKAIEEGDVIPVIKAKRARTKKGTYIKDNKATKGKNEAWVGGKAPKKKVSKPTPKTVRIKKKK